MRAVRDGRLELNHDVRRHLELCLDCRACETACPSGVQYGKLIEPFRVEMEQHGPRADRQPKRDDWFHRYILFGLFPYPDKLRKALVPARIAPAAGARLAACAARACGGCCRRGWAGWRRCCPSSKSRCRRCPSFWPAKGRRRARVALFTGCVGDVLFRQTNWATARVLQENGCDVVVPREPGLLRGDPLPRRRERAGPRDGRRERRGLRCRRRRCDHRQRRRLRIDAQGLRPSLARTERGRSRSSRPRSLRRQGPRRQRVPRRAGPDRARTAKSASRRPITTPATWSTPRRSASSRGTCWRRFPA